MYVRPPKESATYSEKLSEQSWLSQLKHQKEGKNDSLAEALFQTEHVATIVTRREEGALSVIRTAWLE